MGTNLKEISKISVFQTLVSLVFISVILYPEYSPANPSALLLSPAASRGKHIQVDSTEILGKYSLFQNIEIKIIKLLFHTVGY
jgi:hypothetical protein